MTTPVSVIVPTRDRPTMLRRAVRSIAGQQPIGAGHTHPVAEVIVVVDQAPSDATLSAEFPEIDIKIVDNERRPGLAGARNTGIAKAESPWIAFCDDDDWWTPSKLRDQTATADRFSTADFIVGNITVVRGRKRIERSAHTDAITFEELLRDRIMSAHPSTFLVRKDAIDDYIGEIDESLPGGYAEDYDWLLQAARRKPIAVTPQHVTFVQWHKKPAAATQWSAVDSGLARLLGKTPELRTNQEGLARIEGRRAFAQAAMGDRDRAMASIRKTLALNWRETHAYLALPVAARIMSAERLMSLANRFGVGI